MPAIASCHGSPLVVAAAVALLVVGCGGGDPATSTAASTSTASSLATSTTAAATTTTAGSLTGEELVWLEGIRRLHTKADKVLTDAPSNMTPALGTLATKMRGCSRELARLGAPTARLQPVYKLAQRSCAQYDKAAKGTVAPAVIGPRVGRLSP